MTLDNETIKRLEAVKVINKDTGELKRIEIDKTVKPELQAIDKYCREWCHKNKDKKLLMRNLKGTKIA